MKLKYINFIVIIPLVIHKVRYEHKSNVFKNNYVLMTLIYNFNNKKVTVKLFKKAAFDHLYIDIKD